MTTYLFPPKFPKGRNHAKSCMGGCTILLEESAVPLLISYIKKKKKKMQEYCTLLIFEKEKFLIILVALRAHHTPNVTSCKRHVLHQSVIIYRSICVILNIYVVVQAEPCLACIVIQQRIDYTITHCFTEPVKNPHPRRAVCLLKFLQNCKYVCFKRSYFEVACTDDFNTLVSGDSRVKDFRGGVFNRALVSSTIFLLKE